MQRRQALHTLAGAVGMYGCSLSGMSSEAQTSSPQDHVQWVSRVLTRMLTIKPGMTREALSTVFTTEGGIVFSPYKCTFVSRDCPYFKVDVDFRPVDPDRSKRDKEPRDERDGEAFRGGNAADMIVKVSTPYLQFSFMD